MHREVIENKDKGTVEIDGVAIDGFLDQEKPCPKCFNPRVYASEFDTYFCPQCNVWLEKACGDPTCEYCRSRPSHPVLSL